MRTRVYITVDVECAEERGASQPLQGYDLRVFGRFANQRRGLGIELLMDELEAAGLVVRSGAWFERSGAGGAATGGGRGR